MAWIRIRMDRELLPGSGSRTQKIWSWIRIWNKSFRIHNTATIDMLQQLHIEFLRIIIFLLRCFCAFSNKKFVNALYLEGCPHPHIRWQGTWDVRQETWDRRQETWDRRQETCDRRHETGDVRQETWERRRETGDKRCETRDRKKDTGDNSKELSLRDGRHYTVDCETGYMRQEMWYRRPETGDRRCKTGDKKQVPEQTFSLKKLWERMFWKTLAQFFFMVQIFLPKYPVWRGGT